MGDGGPSEDMWDRAGTRGTEEQSGDMGDGVGTQGTEWGPPWGLPLSQALRYPPRPLPHSPRAPRQPSLTPPRAPQLSLTCLV